MLPNQSSLSVLIATNRALFENEKATTALDDKESIQCSSAGGTEHEESIPVSQRLKVQMRLTGMSLPTSIPHIRADAPLPFSCHISKIRVLFPIAVFLL